MSMVLVKKIVHVINVLILTVELATSHMIGMARTFSMLKMTSASPIIPIISTVHMTNATNVIKAVRCGYYDICSDDVG